MNTAVGIIIILMAAGTVAAMMWLVSREKHAHEEHWIPPLTPEPDESGKSE